MHINNFYLYALRHRAGSTDTSRRKKYRQVKVRAFSFPSRAFDGGGIRVTYLLDWPVQQSRHCAGWSSLAARRAHNPKVTGSNPVPATKQHQ